VLKSETPLAGETLAGLLEVDFLDTPQLGNQRVSNSFVPRVRRAFITWKDFTFGQDWSTFQNVAALPERLDFIGPTEGTVFERQPLVRWHHGNVSIALENPETTISVGAASFEADDDVAPDVVLRYDRKLSHGSIALAGIARLLKVDNFVATGVAGVPVIDGVYNAFRDDAGLAAECAQGRDLGMDGKTLIHPAQVAIANAAFAPSADEIDLARRQIAAFEAAEAAGQGVAVLDGRIVENLHVFAARRVLALADAVAAQEQGAAA